ncbi:MAG: TraB/GumN family protein [Bacteroidia bacterium]|nr:TraB/GumN family protein [Bacteroidia bacterium]
MNKLKFGITILLVVLVFKSGMGQNSILWEVSGDKLKKPSYLFGTLKFIGEKEFFLPAKVTNLIKSSDIFAIEDQIDHHAQHELNKALLFPKGESLATQFSEADYKIVQEFFQKEFGISKSVFDSKYANIKPLPLSILMTRLSLGEKVKFYDMELLKFANKHNLETYSLESVDREAAALNTFPMEDQEKALLHSVANFEKQKSEYQKLMIDYPEGNLDEIFEYTLHPTENSPLFLEEFYYKRNEEWLPKIENMMADKISFISIGISHLEGDRGLLALLKAKGYTLKPIQIKD